MESRDGAVVQCTFNVFGVTAFRLTKIDRLSASVSWISATGDSVKMNDLNPARHGKTGSLPNLDGGECHDGVTSLQLTEGG